MSKNMFDLDDELLENNNYADELKKARVLCIRGQYDRALEIYNKILDEDYENEEALIGLLRVHSKDFREFDGDIIEDDIHAIEKLAPDTEDEEYLDYLIKRNNKISSTKIEENTNIEQNKLYKREGNKIFFGNYPNEDKGIVFPIEWDILEENNGKALIISHYILDSKRFDSISSNYENSEIRKWLNNEFINNAFNKNEQALINNINIDNSLLSTGDKTNTFICNNTIDKIFILSVREVKKYFEKEASTAYGTQYAKSQGLNVLTEDKIKALIIYDDKYVECGRWWLRTPSYRDYDRVRFIDYEGSICSDLFGNTYGIRPSLWINL